MTTYWPTPGTPGYKIMNMYDRLRATEVKPADGAATTISQDTVTEAKARPGTLDKPSSSPQATRLERPSNGVAASPKAEALKTEPVNGATPHGSA